MKKFISLAMALVFCLGLATTALADVGDQRVTIGNDLDQAQREQIYKDFGVEPGTVPEIIVTNADERVYLNGIAPEGKIGNVALSCLYIEILEPGSGLTLITENINWVTTDMYAAALATAGITDAKVMVSAPFPVSGTGALTGAYKAYEDITGTQLDQLAKQLGVEELVVTGQLAEYVGSDEATKLIAELKGILDQTQNMTDEQVLVEMRTIAKDLNISLTPDQEQQILKLMRSLEKLDVNALQERLVGLTKGIETARKAGTVLSNIGNSIKNFFVSIGNFFANLFGWKS